MVNNKNSKQRKPKKVKKNIANVIANISSSFNNTIITITETNGDVICWSSSGSVGFKGAKKSTPYAAQLVSKSVIRKAIENGAKAVTIKIKGVGPGKDSALRQFQASDLQILEIKNVTPIPHNGVKKPKKYRRR